MAQRQNIVILEENILLRAILQAAIQSELPEISLSFENRENLTPGADKIYVCLYEKGEVIPGFVMQQDAFEKPVRIGAVIDRMKRLGAVKSEDLVVAIGAYDLETASGMLTHRDNGNTVRLTEKENDILKILHAAQGKTVEKDHLLAQVWGYSPNLETHTLETHMYRLRQKIEENAAVPALLVTQDNGYALKA